MKFFLTFFALLLSATLLGQNFEDTWEGHFSYNSVRSISQGNNRVYAAAENSVFVYDISSQEVQTISTINGLSGEQISTSYYSNDFGLFVIGYENGLIEIVIDGEEEVLSVVDILEKQTIPPDRKRINQFNEFNGNLYIATQFGISVYDLSRLEFGDTYFIGDFGAQIDVRQTAVNGAFIYAASFDGGLRRALVDNDNLIDFDQWELLSPQSFRGAQTVGEETFFLRFESNIAVFNEGSGIGTVAQLDNFIEDFTSNNNTLTVTTKEEIFVYNENVDVVGSVSFPLADIEAVPQTAITFSTTIFAGTEKNGMIELPFNAIQGNQILPNGPLFNQGFSIDASPGNVWLNFGEVDINFNPFPINKRGVSNLTEDGWTNIKYETLFEAFGSDATDLVRVLINQDNPEEVFMSSFASGLLRFTAQEPEDLFDNTNTNAIEDTFEDPRDGMRFFGLDFDRDGNLWTVQSRRDEALIRRSSSGQFQAIDVTPIIENASSDLAFTELKVSREGFVYFGSAENGLIAYNPSSGAFNIIKEGLSIGNLPSNNIRALAFDANNRLWIGTLKGIRVFFNVSGIFEENADVETQEIIILEEGIPQEFLFNISITDIEVDGSNNKWIATATSGVFYVSPNAQETLLRFTKSNSPLPSNNVQDITIDEETGTVYFATTNGLVAFKGTSTAPEEDLSLLRAFPNPVRPGFEGNVTIDGLTANANVKITDIEGNLVFETTSDGGSVLWDTRAFGSYKVRSGVYLILVTTDDALETKVAKVMIVR